LTKKKTLIRIIIVSQLISGGVFVFKINVDKEPQHNFRDDSQLRVVGVLKITGESEWAFPTHKHEDIADMVLITKGEGVLYYNNQKYTTKERDLLVFNQNVLHGEYTNPQNPLETLVINLDGVQIDGLPCNHIVPNNVLPIIKTEDRYPILFYLFDFIVNECIHKEEGYEILCQDAAKIILSIVQQLINKNYKIMSCEMMNFPVILEVVDYLNKNYNKTITLEDIERRFHFSSYYIARKFKEEIGFTINQYITNRRMGEAQKLLIYTNMSISEVALEVGYDNLNHFYAIFKKHVGFTPGKFKEIYNR
jgi:AraC-like DNA-binding protein/quercetin dioxygenase-like cupin family protein